MGSKFGGGPSKRARTQTKTVWPPQDHRNGSRKYVHLLILKSWCFESTYYQLSKKRSKMIRCSHVTLEPYSHIVLQPFICKYWYPQCGFHIAIYKQIAKWPHIHIYPLSHIALITTAVRFIRLLGNFLRLSVGPKTHTGSPHNGDWERST